MASSVAQQTCSCDKRNFYQVYGEAFSLRNKTPLPGPVQAFLSETLANNLILAQQKTLTSFHYRGDLYRAIGNLLDEWNTAATTFCHIDNYVIIDASSLDLPFSRPASPAEEEDSWDCLVSICFTCTTDLKIPERAIWSEVKSHNLENVPWDFNKKQYRFSHSEKCVNCYMSLNTYTHCTQCDECLRHHLHTLTVLSFP